MSGDLIEVASSTIVAAMATESWLATRGSISKAIHRIVPHHAAHAIAQLDAVHAHLHVDGTADAANTAAQTDVGRVLRWAAEGQEPVLRQLAEAAIAAAGPGTRINTPRIEVRDNHAGGSITIAGGDIITPAGGAE